MDGHVKYIYCVCWWEIQYHMVIDKYKCKHTQYVHNMHSYEDRHAFKNDGQIDRHKHKYGWKWKVYFLCMLMRKQI